MEKKFIFAIMRKYFLVLLFFFTSCQKFTTEISDLTMSGKYKVSKLQVIQISNPSGRDSTYLSNQVFINNQLPDPFDTIKINDFYIHFTYMNVMIGWLGNDPFSGKEVWKYGQKMNELIFYNRVPFTFDAYSLGKIQFNYIPTNKGVVFPVILQIDSDTFEGLQLSGLEFTKSGANSTKYRLIFSLTRVGP